MSSGVGDWTTCRSGCAATADSAVDSAAGSDTDVCATAGAAAFAIDGEGCLSQGDGMEQ